MSISLINDPALIVGPYTSRRWLSVHNPIIFDFKREDFNLVSFTVLGFGSLLEVTSSANLIGILVGDVVFIGDSGTFTGAHTVTVINSGGDPKKIIVERGFNYVGTPTPGFMNSSRLSWRIDLKFLDADTGEQFAKGSAFDNGEGLVRIDVKEYLLSQLFFESNHDFFGINRTIQGSTKHFVIEFTELYVGFVGVSDTSNDFYAVKSAQQLKSNFGSNLLEFQTHPAIDPIPEDLFLTHFMTASEKPTYFIGVDANGSPKPYPHGFGFIYSNNGQSFIKIRKVLQLDINLVSLLGTQSDDLNAGDRINTQTLNLRGVQVRTETKIIRMWLEQGATLPAGYQGIDPPNTGPTDKDGAYVDPLYVL